MRECWINVYPDVRDPWGSEGPYVACCAESVERANVNAVGHPDPLPGELRMRGVGYRLHVRLKPEVRS